MRRLDVDASGIALELQEKSAQQVKWGYNGSHAKSNPEESRNEEEIVAQVPKSLTLVHLLCVLVAIPIVYVSHTMDHSPLRKLFPCLLQSFHENLAGGQSFAVRVHCRWLVCTEVCLPWNWPTEWLSADERISNIFSLHPHPLECPGKRKRVIRRNILIIID